MKVLIDSYNTVTQNPSGGVQIRIKNYIAHLQKCGVQAELFDKWRHTVADFQLLHIFKLSVESYQLVRYAKNNNIPVVISSIVPLEGAIRIFANRMACKVLPIHTGYSFLEDILNMADAVVAQTTREANFIMRHYKTQKGKMHVVPNGVSVAASSGVSPGKWDKIDAGRGIVLQVGRFDRNKNQLNVIRALRNTDVPVVFIGGPIAEEADYFRQCKQEATSNMHFLGWVKNDDPLLASAYARAKVVILPSFKEIFGNAIIEGGAAGANLVATRELPIADWGLVDYCSQINPNDTADIKSKVLLAYKMPKNPMLPGLIASKFSWDVVASKHVDIYAHAMKHSAV
jgi:glycosyltransferase involved in cell wall biosynthesis